MAVIYHNLGYDGDDDWMAIKEGRYLKSGKEKNFILKTINIRK